MLVAILILIISRKLLWRPPEDHQELRQGEERKVSFVTLDHCYLDDGISTFTKTVSLSALFLSASGLIPYSR